MRIAIVSVTSKGAMLAKRLADLFAGDIDVFARTDYNPVQANEYEDLGQLIIKLFHQYDGFIFIMSVSMAVRLISPHVRDKYFDPAVVTIDESGSFAISLLSGHLGSANALTRQAGEAIGAQSVITSTIDVLQKPAVDLYSIEINAIIEPFEQIGAVNAAIENCKKVSFFLDSDLADREVYSCAAEKMDIHLLDMKHLADTNIYDAAVVVTDKELYMAKPHVFLRPATLAIGLECTAGISSTEFLTAISDACKKIGRSMKSIAILSASSIYEDEIGLLATGQQLEVPVCFINSKQLQDSQKLYPGTGNSDEAAALAAGNAAAILGRIAHTNVKVSVAEFGFRREHVI